MSMKDFHWRSAVFTVARNMALLVRPGVLRSWFLACRPGDLVIINGDIVRCEGVERNHITRTDSFRYASIDGSSMFSMFVREDDRVEKLDLIGYSDVKRFLNGTQPQFIADVKAALLKYQPAAPVSRAEREAQRRANETPEQSAERRRKNRDNMRRKRAKNKGLI